MRPLLGIAASLAVFAAASAAQDAPDQQKAAAKAQIEFDQMLKGAKVIGIEAGIMGPAVKGAPYAADEVHETTQVLADGTRIHNESKTTVYRDSQGRIRRESPGQVMIWDSAAGSSYMLNQSNQTGQKMQMNYMVRRMPPTESTMDLPPQPSVQVSGDAGPGMSRRIVVLKDIDPKSLAHAKADARLTLSKDVKKEPLGNQIIEGVTCEGVRFTTTIETGAIGNDRPIQSTEERWYSPDLQIDLMVRKTDPRTGEDTVRLTNVRRIEPDPSLFTVPAGYQMK